MKDSGKQRWACETTSARPTSVRTHHAAASPCRPTTRCAPPSFRFVTPSGRFEVNREICQDLRVLDRRLGTGEESDGIRAIPATIRESGNAHARWARRGRTSLPRRGLSGNRYRLGSPQADREALRA